MKKHLLSFLVFSSLVFGCTDKNKAKRADSVATLQDKTVATPESKDSAVATPESKVSEIDVPTGCDPQAYAAFIADQKKKAAARSEIDEILKASKEIAPVEVNQSIVSREVFAVKLHSYSGPFGGSSGLYLSQGKTLVNSSSDAVDPCYGNASQSEHVFAANELDKLNKALLETKRVDAVLKDCATEDNILDVQLDTTVHIYFKDSTFVRYLTNHSYSCLSPETKSLPIMSPEFIDLEEDLRSPK